VNTTTAPSTDAVRASPSTEGLDPCGNRDYCGRHPFCGCGGPTEEERDEEALLAFTTAMRDKLAKARERGRGGWHNPDVCSLDDLRRMLRQHLLKGDPVDVANFALFLHQRGASTAFPKRRSAAKVAKTWRGNE